MIEYNDINSQKVINGKKIMKDKDIFYFHPVTLLCYLHISQQKSKTEIWRITRFIFKYVTI